jgi:hypothetical protein
MIEAHANRVENPRKLAIQPASHSASHLRNQPRNEGSTSFEVSWNEVNDEES